MLDANSISEWRAFCNWLATHGPTLAIPSRWRPLVGVRREQERTLIGLVELGMHGWQCRPNYLQRLTTLEQAAVAMERGASGTSTNQSKGDQTVELAIAINHWPSDHSANKPSHTHRYELYNTSTGRVEDVLEMTEEQASQWNAARRAEGSSCRWIAQTGNADDQDDPNCSPAW